jgi:glutamine synthetase
MNHGKKFEYVWLDGYQPEPSLRSKVKIDNNAVKWSFEGSSTQQAEGKKSDCVLNPVSQYFMLDRIRPDATRVIGGGDMSATYVMCEVLDAENNPHPSNTRNAVKDISENWWFGFEQEYFMYKDGRPLGWPAKSLTSDKEEPRPQGDYYCGVGEGNVVGREIVDRHTEACMNAEIGITGTNAEVALGQWEFQVLGKGVKAGDDLWMARYILIKIAEKHGVSINFAPKPVKGDWTGTGMHTNFSNNEMRSHGTEDMMNKMCEALGKAHKLAIKEYGSDNDQRLTGLHETQSIDEFSYGVSDRGASIRIPIYTVQNDWNGYLEDRRPAGNADPYRIIRHIVNTLKILEPNYADSSK